MVRRLPWVIPLCSGVVAALVLLDRTVIGPYAILAWAVLSTVLLYRAARAHTGQTRRFMNSVVAAAILMCIGFVVRGVHGMLVGVESPIPSPADLFHIPTYLLFLRAALITHRERSPRRNSDAWLDAGAVVTALIMVLWVTFFADYVLSDVVPLDTRIVNGIYNLIILITFTVFVRITATPGRRPPAYYLLGAAGFAYFVVDLAASYSLVRGQGLWATIALSPIVFGLIVQAFRHPSAAELLEPDLEAEVSIGPLRLSIISAAIIAPIVVLVVGDDQRSGVSLGFLVAASLILSFLVVTRVVRLLIDQRDTARLDRQLAAEVAALAGLDSTAAVIGQLPGAVGRLVRADATVGWSAEGAGRNRFELPAALLDGFGELADFPALHGLDGPVRSIAVTGIDEALPPAARRVVELVIRDAGLLVDSLVGREALARERTEAEANRRIAASERRFRALVERSTDLVIVVQPDATVSYVTDSVRQILGVDPEEVVGTTLTRFLHRHDTVILIDALAAAEARPDGQHWHELRFLAADGSVRLLRFVLTNLCVVPEVGGLVINASDVTERRRLERDLHDARLVDRLTLLPNRTGFLEELELTVRRRDVDRSPLAVAAVNIRDFKAVNDALAPALADQVLIRCASLIRQFARLDDVVARPGGDGFLVLMRDAASAADAMLAIERILAVLEEPMVLDSREITVKADAGVVFSPAGEEEEAHRLVRDANIALSMAKRLPQAGAVLFEAVMATEVSERLELRSGMARGLANGEFRLVYQPVVEVATGRVASLEALARWNHPRLGPVPPLTFIAIAEQSDQIDAVGEWALRTACRQLRTWADEGIHGFRVAVNMSVHQLRRDDIVARVERIVDSIGVDPGQITIEVTESVLIDNSDLAAGRMRALRAAGFLLAIDDFGTGYSSLGYLQRYEFDVLKIDKIFVDPLADPTRQREREVVRSIISLARGLGARTVAEGVETAAQLAVLAELGCDLVQGYHLFRPLEVPACGEVLRSASLSAPGAGGTAR